jgi:protein FAM32A
VRQSTKAAPRTRGRWSVDPQQVEMADSYSNVVGGGLKLKGIGKKKKKKEEASEHAAAAAVAAVNDAAVSASAASSGASSSSLGHTAAEMRRLEVVRERKLKALERGEIKSHRDQVKDFNSYLSQLTEHYDLPKVSKGN